LLLGLLRHFNPVQWAPVTGDSIKIVNDATSKYGMTKDQHLGFEAAA
jgi:hypothetical protein